MGGVLRAWLCWGGVCTRLGGSAVLIGRLAVAWVTGGMDLVGGGCWDGGGVLFVGGVEGRCGGAC